MATEIDHPHQPETALAERKSLAEGIERWGSAYLVDSLLISAMAQPKQGSFSGYLWAVAEEVSGLQRQLALLGPAEMEHPGDAASVAVRS